MNMEMAVEDAVLARPFFLGRTPQRTEAHVNNAGTTPLPLEAAGRMLFNAAWTHDFRVGADRHFPEIEQARTRETWILRALALFQQSAPRITVGRAADHFNNLPAVQLDFDLREGAGEMARCP